MTNLQETIKMYNEQIKDTYLKIVKCTTCKKNSCILIYFYKKEEEKIQDDQYAFIHAMKKIGVHDTNNNNKYGDHFSRDIWQGFTDAESLEQAAINFVLENFKIKEK